MVKVFWGDTEGDIDGLVGLEEEERGGGLGVVVAMLFLK